ncbi:LIM/homeobox protein Awh-like isoform X2 [Toxorhynchites rutilus septentrionalis]|uniref:LIM/homeobox protein Awh-like isoform X2 n=1 Tax=Toxorhynchites rutilus septentrionalis TaxID=329112 RepID=UPI0024796014|nr:LIM/homeobox protein Awh-like isoform X2 [Toxorhynchites rutilus septentrionalis]
MKTEFKSCRGCSEAITDRFMLEMSGCAWHASCLQCSVCYRPLEREVSCYFKDGEVYCKQDYVRKYQTSCAKCSRPISPTDWVRRARNFVFHLACFACDSCERQLSTGEQFVIIDDRVLCKTHYMELIDDGTTSSEDGCDVDGNGKNKTKRIRTTFTEDQIQILQNNFQIDSNPDGQDLERIALATGLSKRVTQVWFQNSRARQKKHGEIHFPTMPQQSANQCVSFAVPRGQELLNGFRSDMNNNSSGNDSPGAVPMGEECAMAKASIFNHHGFINLMV